MNNDTPFECVVNLVGGLLVYFAWVVVTVLPILVVTGNFNPHGAVNGLLCLGAFVSALALVAASIGVHR